MSWTNRLLLAEAVVCLALAQVGLRILPFRHLIFWLDRAPAPGDLPAPDRELARRIGRTVATAARNVPWRAVCLPQALAVKAMIARRGHDATVLYGAGRDRSGALIAHAWVEAGDRIVVGERGVTSVALLARFGGRSRAA